MSGRKIRLAGGLLVLCLAVWGPGIREGKAQTSAGSEAKRIAKEQEELKRLRQRIEDQQRKSREAARRENSILANLEEVDYQRTLKKKELTVVNLKLVERDNQIAQLDRDLRRLRTEIDSKQDRVRERVRVLYQEGRHSTLKALFSSRDYYDFIKQYYYMSWVSRKEADLLEGYRAAVAELAPKEEALRTARKDLVGYKTEITEKLSEIQVEKRRKDRLLAGVRNEKNLHEKTIRELEESSSKLKDLIEGLERQRKSRSDREAVTGFSRQKGHLDWPTQGNVVSRFGRQKHPQFDTFVVRKGIEIAAGSGRPIRSVYDGTVVFADWFRGFGLLVILDHGDQYFSLYAHAAKLLVAPGERVAARQIIGEIGDTGLTGDTNLYFEIRRGKDAVDPLQWLKRG